MASKGLRDRRVSTVASGPSRIYGNSKLVPTDSLITSLSNNSRGESHPPAFAYVRERKELLLSLARKGRKQGRAGRHLVFALVGLLGRSAARHPPAGKHVSEPTVSQLCRTCILKLQPAPKIGQGIPMKPPPTSGFRLMAQKGVTRTLSHGECDRWIFLGMSIAHSEVKLNGNLRLLECF
jgi:hypothetical protein